MGAVRAPPLGSVWMPSVSGYRRAIVLVHPLGGGRRRFLGETVVCGGPLRGRFRKSIKCRWLFLSQEVGVVGICRDGFALSGVG